MTVRLYFIKYDISQFFILLNIIISGILCLKGIKWNFHWRGEGSDMSFSFNKKSKSSLEKPSDKCQKTHIIHYSFHCIDHFFSDNVMAFDIMTYDVITYDVMTYDVMTNDIMT